jgi:hypothetical protein
MMYKIDLAVIAAAAEIAILAAVCLWSKDLGRQHRAWDLGSADGPDAECTKPWLELEKQGCAW